MLCEKCNKNEATHKITQNINGTQTAMNLCEECAGTYGINDVFKIGFGFSDFINSFFDLPLAVESSGKKEKEKMCHACGRSFKEISTSGKMGCSNCYSVFREEIMPTIERIHGKTQHIGVVPNSAGESLKQKHLLEVLKKQLKEAINTQKFENAAELRDKIANLENAKKEDGIDIHNSTPKKPNEDEISKGGEDNE